MPEHRTIAASPRLAAEPAPVPSAARTGTARWSLPFSLAMHAGVIALAVGLHAPPAPPPAVVAVELSFVAAAAEPPAPSPDTGDAATESLPDAPMPPVADTPVAEPSAPVPAEPLKEETKEETPPPVRPPIPARRPSPGPPQHAPSPIRALPAAIPPTDRSGRVEQPAAQASSAPATQPAAPAAVSAPPSDPPANSDRQAADYFGTIQARLARHKTYPQAARLKREEGTVVVRFTIVADGTITGWAVVQGSGHGSLDRAAEEMIQRASPLPPIPAGMGRAQIDITLPVRYALQ
ncbi:TonB family protein [Azospirillum melinis]|uniref:Protein TonB n=1 Tax=Azospirillum melinis TaxID=328839 RepID=A0ABX2KK79_9PROT|nr:energy transducer TonB [Azospirillum melinis]MBP2305557.1 protein TonB [Azospirillum melinis]NUB02967.1 TonB family protein [Azospirillum melinis]